MQPARALGVDAEHPTMEMDDADRSLMAYVSYKTVEA